MTNSESHTVRNGVIATVLGSVVLAILGELWPPVKTFFVWLWIKIQAFFGLFGENYSVPGWALTILGLVAFITIVRTIIGLLAKYYAASQNSYVDDMLFGAKWRWSWFGKDILNLWCFCPTCDSELVYDDSSTRFQAFETPKTLFICEHCNRNVIARVDGGGKNYALSAVEREIRRRIRTGES